MSPLTILAYRVEQDLSDVSRRIEDIREMLPPRLAAKLTTARDLLNEVEAALADGPASEDQDAEAWR